MQIMQKVRAMFDVDAVPEEINSVLCEDRVLRELVKKRPGLRLPGAFDEFEIAVRAIVGQQVSVKGATTVMGRIADQYGAKTEYGRVFPRPETLADLDPESLPMPSKRARAINCWLLQWQEVNLDLIWMNRRFTSRSLPFLVSDPGQLNIFACVRWRTPIPFCMVTW